jgi:hypothetical protein
MSHTSNQGAAVDRNATPRRNPAAVAVVVVFRLAVVLLVLLGTKEIWRDLELVRLVAMTNQAGPILGVVMAWGVLAALGWVRRPPAWLVGGITAVLLLVYVVATFVLPAAGPGPGPALPPVVFGLYYGQVMHEVLPAAALVSFLLFEPHRRLRPRHTLYWLAYLLGYVAFVLVRGALVDGAYRYPYPILDPTQVGWAGVGRNTLLVGGLLLVTGAVVLALDRLLPARAFVESVPPEPTHDVPVPDASDAGHDDDVAVAPPGPGLSP